MKLVSENIIKWDGVGCSLGTGVGHDDFLSHKIETTTRELEKVLIFIILRGHKACLAILHEIFIKSPI